MSRDTFYGVELENGESFARALDLSHLAESRVRISFQRENGELFELYDRCKAVHVHKRFFAEGHITYQERLVTIQTEKGIQISLPEAFVSNFSRDD